MRGWLRREPFVELDGAVFLVPVAIDDAAVEVPDEIAARLFRGELDLVRANLVAPIVGQWSWLELGGFALDIIEVRTCDDGIEIQVSH